MLNDDKNRIGIEIGAGNPIWFTKQEAVELANQILWINAGQEPKKRKVIQMLQWGTGICALCDDGSMWCRKGDDKWIKLMTSPQD